MRNSDFNIMDYGAKNDGITLSTVAIQSAIDACFSAGGGRVTVPAGVFITGSIFLKSNVELHLCHGSLLKASENLDDYNSIDAYEQNYSWPPEEWVGKHLIIAVECENVAITGSGIVDGSASAFYEEPIQNSGNCWREGFAMAKDKEKLRPGQLICFIESNHVTVRDITVREATCWSLYLYGCEYVTVSGIKVFNKPYYANTDGIDIDCSRMVTVTGCLIETGDDAITLRCAGSKLKKVRPCEYVTVSNCVLSTSCCGFRIGVGSGIIRHARISNVVVRRAGVALHYQTSYLKSGEAHIYDVNVSGLSAIDVGYAMKIESNCGYIKDFSITDMNAYSAAGILMSACGGELSGVLLHNVNLFIAETERAESERCGFYGKPSVELLGVTGLTADGVKVNDEREYARRLHSIDCKNLNFINSNVEE